MLWAQQHAVHPLHTVAQCCARQYLRGEGNMSDGVCVACQNCSLIAHVITTRFFAEGAGAPTAFENRSPPTPGTRLLRALRASYV